MSRDQLSANTRARLEQLARWQIDPVLLKFSRHGPKFEGGYGIVSKAHLASSSIENRERFVESSARDLKPNNRIAKSQGDKGGQDGEASDEEVKHKVKEGDEREEHEADAESSGRWKTVAVKKMKIKTPDEGVRVLGLTIREVEFLTRLSHENIINLEGFVQDVSRKMFWLVFLWEDNGNLKDFVGSHEWEIPERISLINDVAAGVEYIHGRNPPICHGDVKSINVLVNSKCRAVITDFGSARHLVAKGPNKESERAIKEPQVTRSLEATGCPPTNTITLTCNQYTLRWAAPELLAEDDATLASDIWALGCVAYEVITNCIPFQDVKDAMVIKCIVRGDLPSISSDARMLRIQALCTLVRECWNVNPRTRPTAEDCRNSLKWMPMIVPNPGRTADSASLTGRSAELLMKLGDMHEYRGDYFNASKYYGQAMSLYSENADSRGKANALLGLAQLHGLQQKYSQATSSYSQALEIFTECGEKAGRAIALVGLAHAHRLRKEYSQAIAFYSESLQIGTDIDDKGRRASALWGLAHVHQHRNEYSQAVAFYSECLQIRTDTGDRRGRAEALRSLAEVHRLQKGYSRAMTLLSEALSVAIEIGDTYSKAFILFRMANVHRDQRDQRNAIDHYKQAAEIYKEIGHTNEAIALARAAKLRRLVEGRAA